jgi:hypothetical protein
MDVTARFVCSALLLLGLLPARALGAATTDTPSLSHRYLIVLETSRSMQSRAQGTQETMQGLLGTLNKELHAGDTLGVWAFNDQLYAGKFPLQVWSSETQASLAVGLLSFVQTQAYEKRASFDKVLPELNRLVGESPFLTVILITTGEDRMRGTPFDDAMNQAYNQWRDQQQKSRMPVVTVLRAFQGKFAGWTVTPAPWPPELPPMPAMPEVAKEKSVTPIQEPPKPPPTNAVSPTVAAKSPEPNKPADAAKASPAPPPGTATPVITNAAPPVVSESKPESRLESKPEKSKAPPLPELALAAETPLKAEPAKITPTVTPTNPPPQPAPVAAPIQVSEPPPVPLPEPRSVTLVSQPAPHEDKPAVASQPSPQPTNFAQRTAAAKPDTPPAATEKPAPPPVSETAPTQSRWQDNFTWLVLVVISGGVAGVCFLLWIGSLRRPQTSAPSTALVQASPAPSPPPEMAANPAKQTQETR